jgi:archaellum component FlaC
MEQVLMKLQETTDKANRNEGRIKKLEGDNEVIHQLATSVAVMAEQIKNMNNNVSTLTNEVGELKEKPAKRWESIVEKVIWAVVAAVVGFLLAKIGL